MPWVPELFSAPALERIRSQASAEARVAAPVPYFPGLMSGEPEALVGSFSGEPELHHPVRGRVKGRRAFERLVAETNAWLAERGAVLGGVERLITPRRGVEEASLTIDSKQGRIEVPVGIVADRADDGRIIELRIYFSNWLLTGRHSVRPPLLQPDPDLSESDVIGEYQRALVAGDVQAAAAAFEPDGYVREPAGGARVHRGHDALVDHYGRFFSHGGGIELEHCAVTEDGHTYALEYNFVRWGATELLPQAGLAVYERGQSGKLAGARYYDDAEPPPRPDP
jgi:hypothetical protein